MNRYGIMSKSACTHADIVKRGAIPPVKLARWAIDTYMVQ
jgi:hypothetical protein